jgi:UDP:flavonoid glycosyltransferase YjiC (YdhE family)
MQRRAGGGIVRRPEALAVPDTEQGMDASDENPRRFLFSLWEGGGNVAPQIALARKLVRRGHTVRVLADPSIRGDAEAAGCEFVPFRRAPHRMDRSNESDFIRDFEAKHPVEAFTRIRDRLMFGPALAFAEDALEELAREPADVVVSDFILLGVAAAAERAGIPCALLVHTVYLIPRPGIPAPGPGFLPMRGPVGRLRDAFFGYMFLRTFQSGFRALNEARARLGLPPVGSMREVLGRAERVLVLASPSVDFGENGLPPNTRYVGAQLDDPAWAEPWDSPWPADHLDPLVVVGLSTTNQGQTRLAQRAIDALGGLSVRGLLTTGPAVDPAHLAPPANVVVCRSAPHAQIFREASAVVTHAGHGTVMRALAAGLPLVCIPMGRDQGDVAARVVASGAGVRLSPKARPEKLRSAVREVLSDPSFRLKAQELARAIAAECAEERGVAELERLAAGTPSTRSAPLSASGGRS